MWKRPDPTWSTQLEGQCSSLAQYCYSYELTQLSTACDSTASQLSKENKLYAGTPKAAPAT